MTEFATLTPEQQKTILEIVAQTETDDEYEFDEDDVEIAPWDAPEHKVAWHGRKDTQ